jgi:hypothetical protein
MDAHIIEERGLEKNKMKHQSAETIAHRSAYNNNKQFWRKSIDSVVVLTVTIVKFH